MKLSGIQDILEFLQFLRSKNIFFRIEGLRAESIMVTFTLVGCRVEFDFFEDHIEFSYFTGDEGVHDDWKMMEQLLNDHWSDD
jgi:hypothetical protein